jgi:glycerate-2-kinase
MTDITKLRRDALDAWRAGVRAASPVAAIERALRTRPELRATSDRTLVVATGKAAIGMLRGVGPGARGWAIVPEGADTSGAPAGVQILHGGHPLPTHEGIRASRDVLAAVTRLDERARLLFLVSGGSSALFEVPQDAIDDDDLIDAYAALLASGMPIDEMNCVRRALSKVKGGRLAEAAYPARVVTLAISDVPGDVAEDIGSGPTATTRDAPDRALAVVERYDLAGTLGASVLDVLREHSSAARDVAPTRIESFEIVVRASQSEEAAEDLLDERGYEIVGTPVKRLAGPATAAAWALVEPFEKLAAGPKAVAVVLGGETTVQLPAEHGRGGRNQHLAGVLAAALAGREGFACMVGGTDGRDGNSDAAGALVDGATAARAASKGQSLDAAPARYDSGSALAAAGDAIVTGPTGTNVADLLVAAFASTSPKRGL